MFIKQVIYGNDIQAYILNPQNFGAERPFEGGNSKAEVPALQPMALKNCIPNLKKPLYFQVSESNTASTVSYAPIEKRLWTVDRVPPVLMSPRRQTVQRDAVGAARFDYGIRSVEAQATVGSQPGHRISKDYWARTKVCIGCFSS